MQGRNLVVARVGRNSLHSSWIDPNRPRHWDLVLCPYQELAPEAGREALKVADVMVGPKWTGLRQLLSQWKGWLDYDYIWLPDDDLFADQGSVNRLFELARSLSFDLCAPALQEASYYAHFITMRNRRCFARRTGFVEIMAPCFSRAALQQLLPTLELTSTGWGWGLDSLWPRELGYRNVGIIDAAAVLHTRPVGNFRDAELGRRVREESDWIMDTYDCRQVHTTFAAIGPDLSTLELTPEALAARLVEGWSYLFESNPAVLPWIVDAQRPPQGWFAYPIAGSPSCAAA